MRDYVPGDSFGAPPRRDLPERLVANAAYIAAASPDVVLALVRVAQAAEMLRAGAVGKGRYADYSVTVERDNYAALVHALAALPQEADQ